MIMILIFFALCLCPIVLLIILDNIISKEGIDIDKAKIKNKKDFEIIRIGGYSILPIFVSKIYNVKRFRTSSDGQYSAYMDEKEYLLQDTYTERIYTYKHSKSDYDKCRKLYWLGMDRFYFRVYKHAKVGDDELCCTTGTIEQAREFIAEKNKQVETLINY